MNKIKLRPPYLVFVGDQQNNSFAKTGFGLVHWSRERVLGQLRFGTNVVDLGVPDLRLDDAKDAGVNSLLIGVAPVGGLLPDAWWRVIVAAAELGLDIVSGLHGRLSENQELVAVAEKSGARLIDIRVPPRNIPVGSGDKRTGKRVLTVGTDCAVGKKYSALTLTAAFHKAGAKATFRATGQTGIMIAGEGLPIDSVVSDFVSGAAELVSPDNEDSHWDVIEGQGSLFHPGFGAVSLGLLHGSQPDAVIVCHDATRTTVLGWPEYDMPTIADCIALNVELARRTNPNARCAGVCVNTSGLSSPDRAVYMQQVESEFNLPCVDPLIDGCDSIARLLMA